MQINRSLGSTFCYQCVGSYIVGVALTYLFGKVIPPERWCPSFLREKGWERMHFWTPIFTQGVGCCLLQVAFRANLMAMVLLGVTQLLVLKLRGPQEVSEKSISSLLRSVLGNIEEGECRIDLWIIYHFISSKKAEEIKEEILEKPNSFDELMKFEKRRLQIEPSKFSSLQTLNRLLKFVCLNKDNCFCFENINILKVKEFANFLSEEMESNKKDIELFLQDTLSPILNEKTKAQEDCDMSTVDLKDTIQCLTLKLEKKFDDEAIEKITCLIKRYLLKFKDESELDQSPPSPYEYDNLKLIVEMIVPLLDFGKIQLDEVRADKTLKGKLSEQEVVLDIIGSCVESPLKSLLQEYPSDLFTVAELTIRIRKKIGSLIEFLSEKRSRIGCLLFLPKEVCIKNPIPVLDLLCWMQGAIRMLSKYRFEPSLIPTWHYRMLAKIFELREDILEVNPELRTGQSAYTQHLNDLLVDIEPTSFLSSNCAVSVFPFTIDTFVIIIRAMAKSDVDKAMRFLLTRVPDLQTNHLPGKIIEALAVIAEAWHKKKEKLVREGSSKAADP